MAIGKAVKEKRKRNNGFNLIGKIIVNTFMNPE